MSLTDERECSQMVTAWVQALHRVRGPGVHTVTETRARQRVMTRPPQHDSSTGCPLLSTMASTKICSACLGAAQHGEAALNRKAPMVHPLTQIWSSMRIRVVRV